MFYFEILEGLYKSKIRYLVVGGLSVNLYGVPRVTQDVDIVIAMDEENVLKITSLLKELGYVPRLPVNPNDLANHDKVKDWIENKNLNPSSTSKNRISSQVNILRFLDFIFRHYIFDFKGQFSISFRLLLTKIDIIIKYTKSKRKINIQALQMKFQNLMSSHIKGLRLLHGRF